MTDPGPVPDPAADGTQPQWIVDEEGDLVLSPGFHGSVICGHGGTGEHGFARFEKPEHFAALVRDVQQARFLPAALDIIDYYQHAWRPHINEHMPSVWEHLHGAHDDEPITNDQRAVLALIEERHDG